MAALHAEMEADRRPTRHETRLWIVIPRLAEPDEEGIDLALDDHRRRFIAVSEGTTFIKASPVTDEEKAEAEAIWKNMTDGMHSPEKKKKGAKK